MRTEQEIRKRLHDLENETLTSGPFTEFENIARKAAKQALEWVLEETENLLTYWGKTNSLEQEKKCNVARKTQIR
jgi:hypothetical protein